MNNVFADRPAGPPGLKAGHGGLPIGKNTLDAAKMLLELYEADQHKYFDDRALGAMFDSPLVAVAGADDSGKQGHTAITEAIEPVAQTPSAVTVSEAKGLVWRITRFFAMLRMTRGGHRRFVQPFDKLRAVSEVEPQALYGCVTSGRKNRLFLIASDCLPDCPEIGLTIPPFRCNNSRSLRGFFRSSGTSCVALAL